MSTATNDRSAITCMPQGNPHDIDANRQANTNSGEAGNLLTWRSPEGGDSRSTITAHCTTLLSPKALFATSISHLPVETLSSVFEFAGEPHYQAVETAVAVSCVCKQWREIAINTPGLWRNVVVRGVDNISGTERLALVRNFLERSGAYLLDVELSLDNMGADEFYQDHLAKIGWAIIPHLPRIRSFEFSLPHWDVMLELFGAESGISITEMPMLEALTVIAHGGYGDDDGCRQGPLTFPSSPRLQTLTIREQFHFQLPIDAPAVEDLEWSDGYPVIPILRSFPNLKGLSFTFNHHFEEWDTFLDPDGNYQPLAVTAEDPIILPTLTHLDLFCMWKPLTVTSVINLLSLFSTQAVTHCALLLQNLVSFDPDDADSDQEDVSTSPTKAIQIPPSLNYPNLIDLHLTLRSRDEDGVLEFILGLLRRMPSLEELTVEHGCGRGIAQALSDPNNTDFLPKLHTLTLTDRTMTSEIILAMMASRNKQNEVQPIRKLGLWRTPDHLHKHIYTEEEIAALEACAEAVVWKPF